MMLSVPLLCLLLAPTLTTQQQSTSDDEAIADFFTVRQDYPRVLIAFFARNSAVLLPWFLGQLENVDYPKEMISLHIRSDHNDDETVQLLKNWIQGLVCHRWRPSRFFVACIMF